MAMSKDRVSFFLPMRYFQPHYTCNGMERNTCIQVLEMSFGLHDWIGIMSANSDGFYIICRPSQFARFIIHRNEVGNCINGIKDLEPKLVKPTDVYADIANAAGVNREVVKRVLTAACYTPTTNNTRTIDVSTALAR